MVMILFNWISKKISLWIMIIFLVSITHVFDIIVYLYNYTYGTHLDLHKTPYQYHMNPRYL